jgi:hypothetical protein
LFLRDLDPTTTRLIDLLIPNELQEGSENQVQDLGPPPCSKPTVLYEERNISNAQNGQLLTLPGHLKRLLSAAHKDMNTGVTSEPPYNAHALLLAAAHAAMLETGFVPSQASLIRAQVMIHARSWWLQTSKPDMNVLSGFSN